MVRRIRGRRQEGGVVTIAVNPFGSRPPESVYIFLDPEADPDKRKQLVGWLDAVLPFLNWRSHVFLLDQGDSEDTSVIEEFVNLLTRFLERNRLAICYLHPIVQLRSCDVQAQRQWDRFLAPTKAFQVNAFQEQNEVRLLVSPIIEPGPDVSAAEALQAASFFNSRFAIPSFYLSGNQLHEFVDMADKADMRFYIDRDLKNKSIVGQLWANHIFETVLDRVADEKGTLLSSCRGHLVVDESHGGIFSCFKQWEQGTPDVFINQNQGDGNGPGLPGPLPQAYCPGCIGLSLLSMRENVEVNDLESEGHQVFSKVGLALSGCSEYRIAAELAHHASELSEQDKERGAVLLYEGLCYLNLNEFEKADDTLKSAGRYSADQGGVAYHRGLVQFALCNYVEALDRFKKALESGSEQVSVSDICYQIALCHINMEEYGAARPYLERYIVLEPQKQSSPVSFYLGVCDFGEGRLESAIDHFKHALSIRTEEENPGRIHFYIGACLKEIERFDEAIEELEKAVDADPDDHANFNLLGFCYFKIKQHEEAAACFQRAVEIDPYSAVDWASLGSNLRDLGKIEEAVEMYKKALALDPTMEFARINLTKLTKILNSC